MDHKIFAIGDLHGHYDELMALMEKLPISDRDEVVFLGDYVDGGPKTKQVLDQLIKWDDENNLWHFLYGNHEDLMLDALVWKQRKYGDWYLWWNQGGKATAYSYVPDKLSAYERALIQPETLIPTRHLSWLHGRPTFYETKDYFFVHAGLWPDKSIEEQKKVKYAKDLIWIRDDFINSDYDWGKKIIFGHTTDYNGKYSGTPFKPIIRKNKIGIDGMAHNVGNLIAVELPDEKFYYQESLSEDYE